MDERSATGAEGDVLDLSPTARPAVGVSVGRVRPRAAPPFRRLRAARPSSSPNAWPPASAGCGVDRDRCRHPARSRGRTSAAGHRQSRDVTLMPPTWSSPLQRPKPRSPWRPSPAFPGRQPQRPQRHRGDRHRVTETAQAIRGLFTEPDEDMRDLVREQVSADRPTATTAPPPTAYANNARGSRRKATKSRTAPPSKNKRLVEVDRDGEGAADGGGDRRRLEQRGYDESDAEESARLACPQGPGRATCARSSAIRSPRRASRNRGAHHRCSTGPGHLRRTRLRSHHHPDPPLSTPIATRKRSCGTCAARSSA